MIVISDTSPISGLYRIGHLHLLQSLYGQVLIPLAVMEELQRLSNFGYDLAEMTQATWLEVRQPSDLKKVQSLLEKLDEGEANAIALAQEINADFLLIDEIKGRQIAKAEGLRVVGLLGILLEAKSFGLIPAVKPLVDKLIVTANFRVDNRLLQEVLSLAGE